MPTNPSKNKGGDLAEIRYLQGKTPSSTILGRHWIPLASGAKPDIVKRREIQKIRAAHEQGFSVESSEEDKAHRSITNAELRRAERREYVENRKASLRGRAKILSQAPTKIDPTSKQGLVEHSRGSWDKETKQAFRRGEVKLESLANIALSTNAPKRADYLGERFNVSEERSRQLSDRWRGTHSSILTDHPDTSGAIMSRAQGATLPPAHPRSLSSRAKVSPKASRDAWREQKLKEMKTANVGQIEGAAVKPTRELSPSGRASRLRTRLQQRAGRRAGTGIGPKLKNIEGSLHGMDSSFKEWSDLKEQINKDLAF